jgi:hypothetical protein
VSSAMPMVPWMQSNYSAVLGWARINSSIWLNANIVNGLGRKASFRRRIWNTWEEHSLTLLMASHARCHFLFLRP